MCLRVGFSTCSSVADVCYNEAAWQKRDYNEIALQMIVLQVLGLQMWLLARTGPSCFLAFSRAIGMCRSKVAKLSQPHEVHHHRPVILRWMVVPVQCKCTYLSLVVFLSMFLKEFCRYSAPLHWVLCNSFLKFLLYHTAPLKQTCTKIYWKRHKLCAPVTHICLTRCFRTFSMILNTQGRCCLTT